MTRTRTRLDRPGHAGGWQQPKGWGRRRHTGGGSGVVDKATEEARTVAEEAGASTMETGGVVSDGTTMVEG